MLAKTYMFLEFNGTMSYMGRDMRKRVFRHLRTAQPDQGLHSPLTELLDIIEGMTGNQRTGCTLRMSRMI